MGVQEPSGKHLNFSDPTPTLRPKFCRSLNKYATNLAPGSVI